MKYVLLLPIIALASVCCQSSKGTEAPPAQLELSISPQTLSLPPEQGAKLLTVVANADWGVSSSDDSWCKVAPSGGIAGQSQLRVSVTENPGEKPREATLTFRSGAARQTYTVRQLCTITEVVIADAAFKSYLIRSFDSDGDGILSTYEAAAVKSMAPSNLGIKTMAELAGFQALETLDCSRNDLTELNITGCPKLTSLNCSSNALTELSVRDNPRLTTLDCRENPITKIHVWSVFQAPAGFQVPAGAQYVAPDIDIPAGYRLVWQDEFNTDGAALPDTQKWWYEIGGGGWGNNELQTYVAGVSGSEPLADVSNGTLKIILKKIGQSICSIRMNTSEGWTYGWFEARLRLPSGKGTWPAFWMMPKNFTAWPDDGEIDIMEEVGYNPNVVSSAIHCKSYNHGIGTQKTAERLLSTAQSEFHVYALEWTEDAIITYVDGQKLLTFPNDKKGNKDTWPFNAPFYLKLNLAWGGNWGGAQGVDETALPCTYEVDYVRVFQK